MKILFLLVVFGVVHNSVSQDVPAVPTNLGTPSSGVTAGEDKLTNLVDINSLLDLYSTSDKIGKGKDTTIDFIRREGYPYENHYVATPDGYILNLHRIPAGKTGKSNSKVAFLLHGLLASSSDWILAGAGKGLGYILADEGYDVWMGNARGNKYSRNHTRLNPNLDSEFWKFSWHEIGAIDLPTMIDYVLKQTGADGVYYTGHSQGTTSFFVMGAMVPEYNKKIKAQVSLAPIAYTKHMTSPLMYVVATLEGDMDVDEVLASFIGKDEFLPTDDFITALTEEICAKDIGQLLCKNSLFAMCGFSPNQMNTTLLSVIMEQTPAGASTRQFFHYAQEYNSDKFCQYDHRPQSNRNTNAMTTPPNYDLHKVTAPVYLIYSKNDWWAGEKDVNRLCAELGNCVEKFKVPIYGFNHLDFTFGVDAPNMVYTEVVKFLARH